MKIPKVSFVGDILKVKHLSFTDKDGTVKDSKKLIVLPEGAEEVMTLNVDIKNASFKEHETWNFTCEYNSWAFNGKSGTTWTVNEKFTSKK